MKIEPPEWAAAKMPPAARLPPTISVPPLSTSTSADEFSVRLLVTVRVLPEGMSTIAPLESSRLLTAALVMLIVTVTSVSIWASTVKFGYDGGEFVQVVSVQFPLLGMPPLCTFQTMGTVIVSSARAGTKLSATGVPMPEYMS